jgi:integrase
MPSVIEDRLPEILAGKALRTRKLYESAARKLQAILTEYSPQQIRPADVAGIRRGLAATPSMANRCVSVLRLIFDRLVEDEIVDRNPCIGVRLHKLTKRTRRLTLAEYQSIMDEATPRLRAVMALAALTGQRIGDVLSMKAADLTDTGIAFQQQKTGTRLVVAWSEQLRDAVTAAQALGGAGPSEYVLRGRGPLPMAYGPIWRDWRAACEAAGVTGATIHDLRAMAATESTAQGGDAQALMGHSSATMTARYIRERAVPVVHGPVLDTSNTQGR